MLHDVKYGEKQQAEYEKLTKGEVSSLRAQLDAEIAKEKADGRRR